MLVAVRVKLKSGTVEDAYINPHNYLFAEVDRQSNERFAMLFQKDEKERPFKLAMTLDELAELPGFIKIVVKSMTDGKKHDMVICEHAIKIARPYVQKSGSAPMFVLYIVGNKESTITLYTEDDIMKRLERGYQPSDT